MPKPRLSRREFLRFSGKLIGGLAATGLLGWEYCRLEFRSVVYKQVSLQIPMLPTAFNGFKIAHLTDIHFDEAISPQYFERIVEKVNSFQPDLVAITGDFIYYATPVSMDSEIGAVLGKLKANDLVTASPGNHDHWVDIRRVKQFLADSQITVLDNLVQPVRRGNESIYICGVDSYMADKTNLKQVMSQLPEDCCGILLAHEPDFADISSLTGKFDLQLSGHSHGGIVKIPFSGPPVLPKYAKKYPEGLFDINGMYLYTNRGVGTGTYHIRFNCPPEVVIFTLESAG